MPQSLSQIYLHIVFSTKNHQPFIDESIQPELYAYMAKVLFEECGSPATIIGGVADHAHILLNLARTCAVAHLVEMVKKRSSKWIKTKGRRFSKFQWQTGYGVFSVSSSSVERVIKYIANQKEHHKKQEFKDEFRRLLEKHSIDYDENYVWD
ncbi:MAG: transposase [Pyrinomonadaceae bacterium]